jgi:Trp operon repressor
MLREVSRSQKRYKEDRVSAYFKKRAIFYKAVGVVFILLVIRYFIDFFNLDVLPELGLIGSFVGGTLFIIAILLAGVLSDFKESEKIADELPTSITNIILYGKYMQTKDNRLLDNMRSHIKEFVVTVVANFKLNQWDREDIQSKIFLIVDDINLLKENNIGREFVGNLQSEIANITRMVNRIDTITKTKFIPALYLTCNITIVIAVILLLLATIASPLEALILVGSISFVFVFLVFLIADMENPFEVNKNTVADVNLRHLFDLEKHLKL